MHMCRTWLQAKVHQVFQTRLISLSLSLSLSERVSLLFSLPVENLEIWICISQLCICFSQQEDINNRRSTTTMDGGDEAQAREKGKTEEYVERALNKNPNVKFILQVWTRLLFFFPLFFLLLSSSVFCFSHDLLRAYDPIALHCLYLSGDGKSGLRSGSQ